MTHPLPFHRLHPRAILPSRGSNLAAGLDLSAVEAGTIYPGDHKAVRTGWSCAIPRGWYGRVAPRSGLAARQGIDVFAGVIDADYRGEIGVVLFNSGGMPFLYDAGDRIAQLIIERCWLMAPVEVEALDDTTRGAGGFGSTGIAEQQEEAA